jgi:hypothetical protein
MAAAAAAREVDLRKARRDGVVEVMRKRSPGIGETIYSVAEWFKWSEEKRAFFSPVQKNDERKRQARPAVP